MSDYKIGTLELSSNVIAAPMSGVMDKPTRILARTFGAGMVFTELISAQGIIRGSDKTEALITCDPLEEPLGVQLFGRELQGMAKAAFFAEEKGAALIDINMGCPMKKVIKSGAGAALLREPDLAQDIISGIRGAVTVPVTVKIRAGWDYSDLNFCEIGKRAEDSGVDAVILHPRTAKQFFSGHADWEMIENLASTLSIPVVGCGDIIDYIDAQERIKRSGAKFAMIGRGALGRPWVFGETCRKPAPQEVLKVIERHIELAVEHYREVRFVPILRRQISYYTRGFVGAARFRSTLMEKRDIDDIRRHVREFFNTIESGRNEGCRERVSA